MPMTNASVTVIVPTFNRADYINECIDSLLGQTVPPVEVIVVDDGSDDDTRERLIRYADGVRYVRKNNGGKPSAVNLGLGLARGHWVWIFDDDDVALPDAIERRLEAAAGTPGAGFVYSSHQLGSDGLDRRIVRGRLHMPANPPASQFFLEIMQGCFFHLNSALVRRDIYEQLGGLDPALLSSEDYDFQIRLARVARPSFSPAPSFIFRQHSGVRGSRQIRYAASERDRVFRRYSQAVGRKIRSQVALGEFLCPPTPCEPEDHQRRQALLNRVHVMANHGCVQEALSDIVLWLRAFDDAQLPDQSDLASVQRAFLRGWAFAVCEEDWAGFTRALRQLKDVPGGRFCIAALGRVFMRHGVGSAARPLINHVRLMHGAELLMRSVL